MGTTFKKSQTETKSFQNIQHKKFVLIDATDLVVGRLASYVASLLRGKFNPQFTPHSDTGVFVVIINSDKVRFTSNKMKTKIYYRHTGFAGGIKTRTPQEFKDRKQSDEIIYKAVNGMLPSGPLANRTLGNLRVYRDANHSHESQNPLVIDFGSMNRKNKIN